MDILKDKIYEHFNYYCRYTTVPQYYDTVDERHLTGVGTNVYTTTQYVSHKISQEDTLDSLALKYYNNPTFWWVIAYFNNIQDTFIKLSDHYSIIQIPNIAGLTFGNERTY